MEAMVHVNIPFKSLDCVLSKDTLDSCPVESSHDFSFEFDLTVCDSLDISVLESWCSTIELQVGVPYEFDFLCKSLDYPNDECVHVYFVIDANYDLLVEFDLPGC